MTLRKEYRYTREWNGSRTDYWAKIPIKIRVGAKECSPEGGIIDTGAQDSFINQEFANLLGVQLNDCEETRLSGFGGAGRSGFIVPNAKIYIEDLEIEYRTQIILTDVQAEAILGQSFFDNFNVLFEKSKSKFTVASAKLKR